MAPRESKRTVVARSAISAEWARVGGGFTATPATYPVDLEVLLVQSARQAPADARLFFVAASWIGVHHQLVDVRRLGRLLAQLDGLDSATAGAMISVGGEIAHSARLEAVARHCRPLARPRVLFERTAADPDLRRHAERASLPVFTRWGLYCADLSPRTAAIRPVAWILAHCPELRVRALLGANLDAGIVSTLLAGPSSVAELARVEGATYAATHEAVTRLIGRGLLGPTSRRAGKWVDLAPAVARWLSVTPAALEESRDSKSRPRRVRMSAAPG